MRRIWRGTALGVPDAAPIVAIAAFGVDDGRGESLVIVCEVERQAGRGLDPARLADAVRTAVCETHGVVPADVLVVPPAALPRTSSGKVQRGVARERYRLGQLTPLPAAHAHPPAAPAAQDARPAETCR